MSKLIRGDRGYVAHGVKCRFDNISERKANWYLIKSPLISPLTYYLLIIYGEKIRLQKSQDTAPYNSFCDFYF